MGKFNVHGGMFAPKGFFRVNEGGSHESNPNGGVQVGKDEQGIPNMLPIRSTRSTSETLPRAFLSTCRLTTIAMEIPTTDPWYVGVR
jgi:hypothetical protein